MKLDCLTAEPIFKGSIQRNIRSVRFPLPTLCGGGDLFPVLEQIKFWNEDSRLFSAQSSFFKVGFALEIAIPQKGKFIQ